MVVAAVISLHDPVGSGLDNICAWIEVGRLACSTVAACAMVHMYELYDLKLAMLICTSRQ